jgi:hypothetical protein
MMTLAIRRRMVGNVSFAAPECPCTDPNAECILGAVTQKTADYIKQTAEAAAKEKARTAQQEGEGGQLALPKYRWVPVKLCS